MQFKTVIVRTESGLKKAEQLKEQGWKISSVGLDIIQFYREMKQISKRTPR